MPIDLPSNVVHLWEGQARVVIPRELCWKDVPAPDDVDQDASVIQMAMIWKEALERRHPRTKFRFEIISMPNAPAVVAELTDNHPHQEAVMHDIMRLGMLIVAETQHWHVKKGSPAAKYIRKTIEDQYQAQRLVKGPSYDPYIQRPPDAG